MTEAADVRYADAIVDAAHGRLIAVMEDHGTGGPEAVTRLVSIDLASGARHTLASGHDFFSSPALSPDSRSLAWLAWDHPNMPWDGTELWLAEIAADGSFGTPRKVAGGSEESLFQPAWSPSGELHFISDRSGWWNLYRLRAGTIDALWPMEAEFGMPQWFFGMRTYGFDAAGRIVCLYQHDGDTHLAILDAEANRFEEIETPFRSIRDLHVRGDEAVFIGSSPTAGPKRSSHSIFSAAPIACCAPRAACRPTPPMSRSPRRSASRPKAVSSRMRFSMRRSMRIARVPKGPGRHCS